MHKIEFISSSDIKYLVPCSYNLAFYANDKSFYSHEIMYHLIREGLDAKNIVIAPLVAKVRSKCLTAPSALHPVSTIYKRKLSWKQALACYYDSFIGWLLSAL